MTKGNISERDFDILIKLSGIHSEKALLALKKYYVDGVIRKIDPTHVMWTRP
ncbi:PapB/FocB family fimbrial expression transcriptional regulator [Escherichia coli]